MNFPDEVWAQIFRETIDKIRSGSLYKSLLLICHQTKKVGYMFWSEATAKLANHLMTLLQKFPDKPWSKLILSNSNIPLHLVTFQKIESRSISRNLNVTQEFIEAHPEIEWDYRVLSKHPNITIDFILKTCKSGTLSKWDWFNISKFIAAHGDVEKYPTFPWIGDGLVENKKLSLEYLQSIKNFKFNFNLSPNVTPEFIEAHPEINWNYEKLSENQNITWEFIRARIDENWEWSVLAMNPVITWEIFQLLPIQEYEFYSFNKNATWDIILKNLNKKWDWCILSLHPKLTIEIIRKMHDPIASKWNWRTVSQNRNITFQDIDANLDLPWDPIGLSQNPNLTFEIVQKNPDFWDWNEISHNNFMHA